MRHFILLSLGLITFSVSFSQTNFTTLKCKDATNDRIRKNCIINEIKEFVTINYNTAAMKPYARIGTNRIYARFKVNQIGQIVDIQAKATALELEEEAIRTLRSFPTMTPVPQKKKEIQENVFEDTYTLPITFEMKITEIDLTQKRITDNNEK
ncbi:hypothetical protein ABW636_04325 [Aquimarina sp. 2201CG1-2-11]|uniref:hypothetical protein n=1 Tax=Aquimarina discodermiae TaxID=3231043 RepID=UPI0034631A77